MLENFKIHIEAKFPELNKKAFLLACSGGIDSMVLADLLTKCHLNFSLAHCNFRLRGADSEGDEGFVADFARNTDKKFYITHFDTIGYMKKFKVSMQMAARDLRYAWFAEVMEKNGIERLVTAHHADDNLETFLINLSRGTGLSGLTGIPEKTDTIVRPLLAFSREQIERYARANKISWREDRSNSDTKYLRNSIRQNILPELKRLNPSFLKNFSKSQQFLTQSESIAANHIRDIKATVFERENDIIKIPTASLIDLKPLQGYLYGLFYEFGFTEWNDVENLLTAISGKEIISKTHRLVKDRDFLLLKEIFPDEVQTYHILESQRRMIKPIPMDITEVDALSETGSHILYVAKNALKYPLTLRKWEKGDYFHPFGMQGRKKLSKFFKDEKFDAFAKADQWILCSGESIVWVVGKRGDERFKVNRNTENIIKFEVKL